MVQVDQLLLGGPLQLSRPYMTVVVPRFILEGGEREITVIEWLELSKAKVQGLTYKL